MKHLGAIILKFLFTLIILAFILGYWLGWYYPAVLAISLIVAIVGYFIGDLWILPRAGNMAASSADFGISILLIWWIGDIMFKEPIESTGPLFAALVLGIVEWFFHNYLMSRVLLTKNQSKA